MGTILDKSVVIGEAGSRSIPQIINFKLLLSEVVVKMVSKTFAAAAPGLTF